MLQVPIFPFQLNISLNEYAQLMRVYQKSVEQAELLQELQEDFAEEEDLAEDLEVGQDAKQVSLTKSVFLTSRHRYTAISKYFFRCVHKPN